MVAVYGSAALHGRNESAITISKCRSSRARPQRSRLALPVSGIASMERWFLRAVGRFAAAVGESDRYSVEHLQYLRSGYVCQQCGATLIKARGSEAVRCYDGEGKRVALYWARLRGKLFECPVCNHRWPFRTDTKTSPTTFLGRFIKLYVRFVIAAGVLIVSFVGTYVAMNAQRIFPAADKVVVYGRDSCGFTAAMRSDLQAQGIPFVYANIDKPFISEEMWHHLHKISASDPTPRLAELPVVLINHQVLERPDAAFVIAERERAVGAKSP